MISATNKINLLTKLVEIQSSADLNWGPGPELKSAEFGISTDLFDKLQRCENTGFHFHAAPFGIQSHKSL